MTESPFLLAVLALLLGGIGGMVLGAARRPRRRPTETGADRAVAAHLLPDPALTWLRRANGAAGTWTLERSEGGGRVLFPSLDDALVDPEVLELVEERLGAALERGEGTVERLSGATLLIEVMGQAAAGVLLAGEARGERLREARVDLTALLEGLRQRPVIREVARVSEQVTESFESVGMRLAFQLERVTSGHVLVVGRDDDMVAVLGTSPGADPRLRGVLVPPTSPLWAVARGEVPASDSEQDPLDDAIPDRRRRPGRWHLRTIQSEDEAVGAVAIHLPEGTPFAGAREAETAEALRNAGPRMYYARMLGAKASEATTDALSGLPNRRGLEMAIGNIHEPGGAYIALDLDKFKTLNDTHGHAAGDAAVVHVARVLRDQLRGTDVAARVGGDEFAIWLPGETLEQGVHVAERIRNALGHSRLEWQGSSWPLSASFGVASVPESTRLKENLPQQADAALYRAKEGGRNRVEQAAGTGRRMS